MRLDGMYEVRCRLRGNAGAAREKVKREKEKGRRGSESGGAQRTVRQNP